MGKSEVRYISDVHVALCVSCDHRVKSYLKSSFILEPISGCINDTIVNHRFCI